MKPKSLECIFLGFEKGVKGYRLWDPKNNNKVLSRDVIFDEKLGAKDVDKEEVHVKNHTKFFCQKKNLSWRIMLRWSKRREGMKHRKGNKH